MSTVLRYVHTLRYLRPGQISARLLFRARRPRPDMRAAPGLRTPQSGYHLPVAGAPQILSAQRLRILNVELACGTAGDWQPAGLDRLWVYHLHYFDDLSARKAGARVTWQRRLLERWVAENPPGQGPGWDPYPVSRRIVNWVKWALLGQELPPECRASLAVQARWLRRRLEYHLLGNHLFANAAALVHAGLYFEGAEAEGWYTQGMRILARQLPEQVLADGGHIERSPMYHALVLESLLDLINLLRTYGRRIPPRWPDLAAHMRSWLAVMTHPDGGIAFFNDAAFGVAPSSTQLEAYAGRLGLGAPAVPAAQLVVLAPSGYLRAAAGEAWLLCDCAPVGPDYLPAHAHADTLSFEFSLRGRRLLVNSGTSQYGLDQERQRQRGTAAHNCVVVDDQNSSEVWAGFRVARRARVTVHEARALGGALQIAASHDGYRLLSGRNVHTRRWRLDERSLHIEDRVSGPFSRATAHLHLHPQVRAEVTGPAEIVLSCADGGRALLRFSGAAGVAVQPATWHPEFGVNVPNQRVVAEFAAAVLTTHLEWSAPA